MSENSCCLEEIKFITEDHFVKYMNIATIYNRNENIYTEDN
jgi:hypothetical protein